MKCFTKPFTVYTQILAFLFFTTRFLKAVKLSKLRIFLAHMAYLTLVSNILTPQAIYIYRTNEATLKGDIFRIRAETGINNGAITLLGGLVYNYFGTLETRKEVITLFRMSRFEEDLTHTMVFDGSQFYLSGDPTLCLCTYLLITFY